MKTTIRALLLAPLPSEVTNLMARYCAAERYSYKRLLEGQLALDVEKAAAERFSLNSRYSKDAVFGAGALIVSERELVKLRCREWEKKLKAAAGKLKKAKSPVKQARLKAKVARRQRKLELWQRHKEAGTHPPVVFGGKRAFRDRCSGKISQTEWREGRSHRLLSRGDKTKGGNLNLRLVPGGPGGAFLEIAVPGQGRMAPRYVVPVYLPRKVSKRTGMVNGTDWRSMVLAYLETGRAYQVELIRRDGKVYCHITLEEAVPRPGPVRMHLGIDTNPTGLGAALVDGSGNLRRYWWLGDGELTYARADRRSNRVGELAARAVAVAWTCGAALVIEDLKFLDDREVGAKWSRMAHQFVYRGLLQAIERRAFRQAVPLVKVHPAYTSAIGALKYAHQYRLGIHQAAALVIARRGMGLKERVPKPLQGLVKSVPVSEWKAWAGLKRAALRKLKERQVKSLVSWPQHRKTVLGLAEQSA